MPGTRWALLVGVDKYDDTEHFDRLSYCGADALALREVLIGQTKFPANQVFVLHDEQKDRIDQPLRKDLSSKSSSACPQFTNTRAAD